MSIAIIWCTCRRLNIVHPKEALRSLPHIAATNTGIPLIAFATIAKDIRSRSQAPVVLSSKDFADEVERVVVDELASMWTKPEIASRHRWPV